MPTYTKQSLKRSPSPLKFHFRGFKQRMKQFFRLLALNCLCVICIFLIAVIIICLKTEPNAIQPNDSSESITFELFRDHNNFVDPSPHWNDHVQFKMPELEEEKSDWHDYAAMAADRKRTGPGEKGLPVSSNNNTQQKQSDNQISLENGFNAFISDLISVNRSLPDIRISNCHSKRYLTKLPTVSIVIPCRNEYKSVLQRTLHSIYNRTPKNLLKEIIIVDDHSFRGYTIDDMSEYADHHFPNLVKFIRLNEHKGLIYAKIVGAKKATGDVLVFFDSHIECNHNWLPPLLEPIAVDEHICTTPRIDSIAHDNFAYQLNGDNSHRGGFNWDLTYLYMSFNLEDAVDRSKPYKDPVMMGGILAISRRFFWQLGGFDDGLELWGAEQFELSFKIWMCGGMLLSVPCSHVGHIFRGLWTLRPEPKKENYLAANIKRVAEVWMDEYKKYVYETNPGVYNNLDPGNLTEQHAIRKRLKCKSFKWFLEFVAPDILETNPIDPPPDFANGALQSVAYPQLCLDSMNLQEGNNVGVFTCGSNRVHPHTNQFWNFNHRQEVKNNWKNLCLDVFSALPNSKVLMYNCHHQGGNQFWYYDASRKWLLHGSSGERCLEIKEKGDGFEVIVNECSNMNVRMRWTFGFVNDTLKPSKYEKH